MNTADAQFGYELPFVIKNPGNYTHYRFSDWAPGRNYLTDITLYTVDGGGSDPADVEKGVCELMTKGHVASDCCSSGMSAETSLFFSTWVRGTPSVLRGRRS